jgi:hypothetical protein
MLHVFGRRVYKVLLGVPEGRRPLGTSRRRLEDNIKMDLKAMKWRGMDWIDVAEDSLRQRALVNAVMNLRVP